MKILAIDTSSKTCGVCILEDKKEIYKKDLITERSHSIKLMPIIKEVFEKANLNIKDIDLIVCDKGPGSFTGIRIGVATAKAFSDSLDIPIIGVNSLETLAYTYLNNNKLVCSILDAKNDNCYFALYQFNDGICKELIAPKASSLKKCIEELSSYSNITFIGDGSITFKEELQKNIPPSTFSENDILNSYNLGLAGYTKFINNNFESVLPMYLKKPQAQRQLEEKLNGNSNS